VNRGGSNLSSLVLIKGEIVLLVKCKICKNKIDRDTAYRVVVKDKNQYYCNVDEFVGFNTENESRFKVIDLAFEIIGKTTNTILMKDLSEIAKIHTYTKILKYMESNLHDIYTFMNKDFTSEYGKIRYFTAIIKNSIGDFVEKKQDTNVYVDVIEEVKYTPVKKKSFTDFVDEY
jgi:hypothetical protein